MEELEALAGSGKDYVMVADRIAAAQCREPDVAGPAGTGDAVPPTLLHLFKHRAAT